MILRFAQGLFGQTDVNLRAMFLPVAKMLTAQPCQGVAAKVSLLLLAFSVSEAADYNVSALKANGTQPTRHMP